jgi:hypothetical protein
LLFYNTTPLGLKYQRYVFSLGCPLLAVGLSAFGCRLQAFRRGYRLLAAGCTLWAAEKRLQAFGYRLLEEAARYGLQVARYGLQTLCYMSQKSRKLFGLRDFYVHVLLKACSL